MHARSMAPHLNLVLLGSDPHSTLKINILIPSIG